MKPFFIELFDYSHHFNQKLCTIFNDQPDKTSEKALKLFNHILNAHHIWNQRIEAKPTLFAVWKMHTLPDLKDIEQTNYEQTLRLLDHVDFNATVLYNTSNGKSFSNTVRDILFHTINHSTYHRAQIATEFKQNGIEPLASDFVMYKR